MFHPEVLKHAFDHTVVFNTPYRTILGEIKRPVHSTKLSQPLRNSQALKQGEAQAERIPLSQLLSSLNLFKYSFSFAHCPAFVNSSAIILVWPRLNEVRLTFSLRRLR